MIRGWIPDPARLRALASDVMGMGFWSFDPESEDFWCDDGTVRLLGSPSPTDLGSFIMAIDPSDRAIVETAIRNGADGTRANISL